MHTISFVLVLLLNLSSVNAQLGRNFDLKQNYTNFASLRSWFTVYYGEDSDTSSINVAFLWDLSQLDLNFMAIGPGNTKMNNADVWMVHRDSQGRIGVWDMKIKTNYRAPVNDTQQDLVLINQIETNNTIIVEINRKKDTNDLDDAIVTGLGELESIFAFRSQPSNDDYTLSYHGFQNHGNWRFQFDVVASETSPVSTHSLPTFPSVDLGNTPSSTGATFKNFAVPSGVRELSPLSGYKLSWSFPDEETIEITMTSNGNGWVGFGIGDRMLNADIYIGQIDGNGNAVVRDYYGTQDQETPTLDTSVGGTSDILSYNGSRKDGSTVFTFRRRLNSTDAKDKSILLGTPVNLIAAFNSNSDDLNYHGPKNHQQYSLDFSSGFASNNADETKTRKHIAHGVLMAVAWAVFVPAGIIVARFFKYKGHIWFIMHASLLVLAFAMIIAAFGIGINMTDDGQFTQKDKVRISHAWIGLFVVIGATFQLVLGVLADKMFKPDRQGTPVFPDRIHWYLGRSIFLLAIINIFLGISSLPDDRYRTYLGIYGAWCFVLVCVFVGLEVYFHKKNKK